MQHKLMVANRGEIAVRIIRAAQQLGIPVLAVYSEADADSMAVRIADEAVCIGPARSAESYLNGNLLLRKALEYGVTAIHPGYGFLSENAGFAAEVEAAGIRFVGPDAATIRSMGDKATAIATAKEAGVPVVPGSGGELESEQEALLIAENIGYPVLIKASAGGGGRGIRTAYNPEQLKREFSVAKGEATAAFGNGGLYLEKYISSARHIEVQVLGDGRRAVHLFERECSLQRRRQKVMEEAPSPALSDEVRHRLCEDALELTLMLGYRGAGTLEFLYDPASEQFYFIEMNTRIQVEHPVTEMVTGIDLVQWMIRIALGEALTLRQEDISLNGWSLEMRINAEDPERGFFPSPGQVTALSWPAAEGIRIESHLYEGYRIPPYYDSMLAKLVVHGNSRNDAVQKASEALGSLKLKGMKTTVSLHQKLLQCPDVIQGNFHTGWLESWLEQGGMSQQSYMEEVCHG